MILPKSFLRKDSYVSSQWIMWHKFQSFCYKTILFIDDLINLPLRPRAWKEITAKRREKSLLPHLGDTLKPFSSLFSYTTLNCVNTLEIHIIQGSVIAFEHVQLECHKKKTIECGLPRKPSQMMPITTGIKSYDYFADNALYKPWRLL